MHINYCLMKESVILFVRRELLGFLSRRSFLLFSFL
nr:MAG TPA: hypothetical protein [Caudoviricetes sp.]